MPDKEPTVYEAERRATGLRGSYLAYRSDVFHRGAPFGSTERARFTLALAFKSAGQDWIGYNQAHSQSTDPEWVTFAERSTPRELELFGFPPPGHPIWNEALLRATGYRESEILGELFGNTLISRNNPPTLGEEIRVRTISGGVPSARNLP